MNAPILDEKKFPWLSSDHHNTYAGLVEFRQRMLDRITEAQKGNNVKPMRRKA